MALTQAPEEGLKISNAGTNGQFLQKSSNTGGLTWATVSTDIVGDTTPQLGGDLASNGSDIKFADDDKAIFGTGTADDMEIFHESTSNVNQIIATDGKIHLRADEFMLISDDTAGRAIYLDDSNSRLELGFDGTHDATFNGGSITLFRDTTLNAQKDLRFADSDSSNYVAFQAPATIGSNVTWTLPAADGSANQSLTTDGSGTLSWAAAGVDGISSSADATAITIDSSERVMIGTTTEGYANADDLTVATAADTGITIRSGTSSEGIIAFSDGTSGADEYRGYLQYSHSNNALNIGADGTTRFEVLSNGNVEVSDGDLVIGTSGHGINFSVTADSAATGATDSSELFSDYEEGTWTPVLNHGTCTPLQAYYVRCGNMVWVTASIGNISDRTTDAEVRVVTSSLPFNTNISYNNIGPCRHRYTNHANVTLTAIIDGAGIYFGSSDEAFGDGAYHQLHHDEINATYSEIAFAGWFRCAA
tara:strand:+ start:140 stop:1570 length:1431 start_codon:yes stop_codon:yes gene_type:complete